MSMTFKKHNRLGFLPHNEEPFDKIPLQAKVKVGVRSKIKARGDWHNRLRQKLDEWLQ
jgi:hypothetical protein